MNLQETDYDQFLADVPVVTPSIIQVRYGVWGRGGRVCRGVWGCGEGGGVWGRGPVSSPVIVCVCVCMWIGGWPAEFQDPPPSAHTHTHTHTGQGH